ncbi:MAG TPA: hypothetical protein VG248_17410 [Caulobacteraceae bacterium]|nr:hypothetical protein [Caulobacteraceae bacterium]
MKADRLDGGLIEALREIRAAEPLGLALYFGGTFFCSGSRLINALTWRELAGRGLVDVVDARIRITVRGIEFLQGIP